MKDELFYKVAITKFLYLKEKSGDKLANPDAELDKEKMIYRWERPERTVELYVYRKDGYSEFYVKEPRSEELYRWMEFPLSLLEVFYE